MDKAGLSSSFILVSSILTGVEGRYVTVNEVTTAAPTTIVQSQAPGVVTEQDIQWVYDTIFKASTIVTTIPTGSVNTQPVSSKPNPVTQVSTYPTSELLYTIDPSTYSASSFTIVPVSDPMAKSEPTTSSSTGGSPASSTSSTSATTVSSSSSSVQGTTSTSQEAAAATATSSDLSYSSALSTSFPSSAATAASTSSSSAAADSTATKQASSVYSGPIFDPISTDKPLNMFSQEPIPLTVPKGYDTNQIMQTNKFYDNFLLNGQNLSTFTQPYGVFYSTDDSYYGVGISYTNKSQRVFGPDPNANPVEYYTNPVLLKSLVLSAKEFTNDNIENPSIADMGPFSVNMTLGTSGKWLNQALTVPISIGMGFVTAIYDGYTPRLFSQIGIDQIVKSKTGNYADAIQKFVITLMNGVQWNVYVNAPDGFQFNPVSDYEVMGNFTSSGSDSIIVQVAVVEGNENAVDSAAGAFPVGADLDGETTGTSTTYRIEYDVRGKSKSGTTLLYALPHHVASFSSATQSKILSDLTVYTNAKGYLTGVLANTLEMVEDVSNSPGWLVGDVSVLSKDVMSLLSQTVNDELSQDMSGQTSSSSTYTAGKSFDKFAYVLLVSSEILKNDNVTKEGLDKLKSALDPWLNNKQETPFIYDTLCKGITSSAAQDGGDSMSDYGSPFYNDHHFHYGYFVHTAAVVALLDKKVGDGQWLNQHKDWVNSLIRDVANPSTEDTYFPVSRMFDFFHGHSWAHGMFESGDGKDEESTSEDYNFAYGMKLWGEVIGDETMAARGSLMLAVLKRSLISYFLFKNDNTIQPSNIIGNRVAGITFENKIDHTTYFGTKLQYIQGIQMIPLTPASVLIREQDFVQQEWDSLLAPIIDNVQDGWAGILRANQALFDPKTAYNWFASSSFTDSYLDGGASRSWYLAFSALLNGKTQKN